MEEVMKKLIMVATLSLLTAGISGTALGAILQIQGFGSGLSQSQATQIAASNASNQCAIQGGHSVGFFHVTMATQNGPTWFVNGVLPCDVP
jgi:hypothetical protein